MTIEVIEIFRTIDHLIQKCKKEEAFQNRHDLRNENI